MNIVLNTQKCLVLDGNIVAMVREKSRGLVEGTSNIKRTYKVVKKDRNSKEEKELFSFDNYREFSSSYKNMDWQKILNQ